MRLEILQPSKRSRVLPYHIVDYARFRSDFRETDETELHLLEKFHAARSLALGAPTDAFVGVVLGDPAKRERQFRVDVVGEGEDGVIAVFCETGPPSGELVRNLELIERADNSRAVLVYPYRVNVNPLLDQFADSIENGKIQLEQFAWGEHGLERTFRDALEIMDLFTNETRVRMLMPLLERPYGKRHFRSEINPKLVYENLSSLLQHKLIGETEDDLYNLTPVGNRLLCEYLAFVERVRHMLGEDAD
jgi:hypothetical protein